jgi:predicted RNA-binding Zn-ribbon protein involved in translation (DUF1610 family)
MKLSKAMELTEKYKKCPICGNEKIGNGEGTLNISDKVFCRKCKCGWTITANEGVEDKGKN